MSTSKPKPTSVPDHVDPRDEARRIWLVTKMGVLGMYRSQLPRMAAALAYRTIFSIIPVMAIGLLIFGSVVSDAQVESGVRRVLTFAGISQISAIEQESVEDSQAEAHAEHVQRMDDPEQALDGQAVGEQAMDHAEPDPFASTDLEEVITNLITRVNSSIRNVPTGWIALTSGLVLLYAAMSMLIEIEKSFNQLCSAPSGRSWLRRLMLYWTILTAGSLMLAATFLAGDAFTRWVVTVAGDDSIIGAVMAGYGVSVLISTVLLLGAYLIIPNSKIQFRSALAGAFFAAVLWELGKLGFTTYLRYTTGYAKFYGSIAILPLFMLWVYLTWLIVLFGMQASYALQNFSQLVESKMRSLSDPGGRGVAMIDPLVMVAVARAIESGFAKGEPCTAQAIAGRVKLDSAMVTDLLDALTEHGITNRVYQGDAFIGWTPAKPAERIGLAEILKVAHGVDGFRVSGVDEQVPAAIREAAMGACKGMTLAQLADSSSAKKPE
jgi:membrane protein